MATRSGKNFSFAQEPRGQDIVSTYVGCNFAQQAAITDPVTGKKVGVPLFPGSRAVPREFFHCNLENCDVPAGSVVEDCYTAITTKEVEEEVIMVGGFPVTRIIRRTQVAHGRYVHDGTTRTHEEFE